MASSTETVKLLETAGDDLREAMAVVLEHINENSEGVRWTDVNHRLTRHQWENLVQSEVLVDAESGYRLSDRQGVQETLSDEYLSTSPTGADDSWSIFDKLVGVVAVVLFATYSTPEVRRTIGEAVDIVLAPVSQAFPFWLMLIFLGICTGVYGRLLSWFLSPQGDVHDDSVLHIVSFTEFPRRFREARQAEDEATLDRIMEEQRREVAHEISQVSSLLKRKLRPSVWLALIGFPLLEWIRWMVQSGPIAGNASVVLPIVGEQYWSASLIGLIPIWIVWYVLCAYAFSEILAQVSSLYALYTG